MCSLDIGPEVSKDYIKGEDQIHPMLMSGSGGTLFHMTALRLKNSIYYNANRLDMQYRQMCIENQPVQG
jgi:4-diphosphocytidyl-2C-methyl-D-erythritol kinase